MTELVVIATARYPRVAAVVFSADGEMRNGRIQGMPGHVDLRWIGDVGSEVAAVGRHRRPALKEVVQHVVALVPAHAERPGLAEQLSVHLDGRDCLGASEYGVVV